MRAVPWDAAEAFDDAADKPDGAIEDDRRDKRAAIQKLVREVWRLAWPAITHMFLLTIAFFSSRALVGQHSPTELASLQISGTLTWTAYSLFSAFSSGTLAVVARSVGAKDPRAATHAARSSLLFAFALGVLIAALVLAGNGTLLRWLFPRTEPEVLALASAYLHIALPFLPLAFMEAAAAAALQGAGDTRTPLVVAALGNVVNLVLSWLLVFGKAGFPELGVRGAAVGVAATMAIEGLVLTALVLRRHRREARSPNENHEGAEDREGSGMRLRATLVTNAGRAALRRVMAISLPAFAEKVVYHGGFLIYVAMIGLLGKEAMAANQALISIEAVSFLSADGFGVAAAAIVAQKLGARKQGEAALAGWISTGMATLLLTVFGVAFVIASRALMRVFSSDPQIVDLGAQTMIVAAIAQPFMAFATVTGMALRGAGDTKTVLGVMVVCSVIVRLAATWFFGVTLGWGLIGVWLGSGVDWMVRSALFGAAFTRGNWRFVKV